MPGEQLTAYWRRLRDAGLDPIDFHEPGQSLERCVGLVLTGGIDIDPARYNEPPHPTVRHTSLDRDAFESALLDEALRLDLPVLAICRGHQLLNVHLGGSLLQHIESGEHVAQADAGHTSRSHSVRLVSGGTLATLYGSDKLVVNSRHHQAVTPERLAPGLVIEAVTGDGLVEAVVSERHGWVVAVQWHPERDEPSLPGFAARGAQLFAAFAAAAGQNKPFLTRIGA